MDSGPNAYHRCPYCEKAFLNETFLQAHLEKRHADRYIKDWHVIDTPRKRSPKHDQGDDVRQSQNSRNLELLLQKLLDQRNVPPSTSQTHRNMEDDAMRRMAETFDRERIDWQNAMRQMQNEMEDLQHQLNRANSRNRKSIFDRIILYIDFTHSKFYSDISDLKELEDDVDNLTKVNCS